MEMSETNNKIVIIGGGCMGLSAGIQLLVSGYNNVSIVSKEYSPNTTSDGAGALWRPFGDSNPLNEKLFDLWGEITFNHYSSLLRDYGSNNTGIMLVPGYELFKSQEEKNIKKLPYWSKTVLNFKQLNENEMKLCGLDKLSPYAYSYTSIMCEMPIYLQFLMKEFLLRGGILIQGEITNQGIRQAGTQKQTFNSSMKHENKFDQNQVIPNRDSYLLDADLIINCTGLGSLSLLNDQSCYPIRGQLVYVNYPSLYHFYMNSDEENGVYTYIFPRRTDVALGGTYQKKNWSLIPDEAIKLDILKRTSQYVPDLASAPIIKEWVGLRPARSYVRLQLEMPKHIETNNKVYNKQQSVIISPPSGTENLTITSECNIPIIHNYGHGGSGMTLHWGCSQQVVKLVNMIIKPNSLDKVLKPNNPIETNGFALKNRAKL